MGKDLDMWEIIVIIARHFKLKYKKLYGPLSSIQWCDRRHQHPSHGRDQRKQRKRAELQIRKQGKKQ